MILPPGFGRAAIQFSCVGDMRRPVITFGFVDPGVDSPSAIGNTLLTKWRAVAAFEDNSLATSYAMEECDVVVNRAGVHVVGNSIGRHQGTAGFNALPLASCAILRKKSAMGGRKARGRCYLPAGYLGELSVDPAGNIDPALVDATGSRWATFINDLDASGMGMVILHNDATPPTVVTEGSCESIIGTQRRRQRKG